MSTSAPIVITLPGGRRVDASIGRHTVHTDQPTDNGGEDAAPSPFDLFLSSIGLCAGLYVQGFCAKRGIPLTGIRIVERPKYGDNGPLASVDLDLQLPVDFPEKYRGAVVRVIEECAVRRAIRAQPALSVHVSPWT